MKLSAFITILASTLAAAELGGLLICNGANATGSCIYSVYTISVLENRTCYDLPDGYYENAATFAPDGEPFVCFPRVGHCADICTSPTGCTFGGVNFTSPYKFDLGLISWNHLIGSFDCWNE